MSDVKRVIKFRAWDGDKMINPPGYEGTGSGVMIYQLDFEGRVSLTNLYGLDPLEGGAANTTIDNLILMQFTGLHDKNGKEIYEGDVLKIALKMGTHAEYNHEGFWKVCIGYTGVRLQFIKLTTNDPSDASNQYPLMQSMDFGSHLTTDGRNNHYDRLCIGDKYWDYRQEIWYSNDIDIIGNIYSNPELLKS